MSSPSFASDLRVWRRLNCIKQEALGAALGVTQPAVSRWERGLDEPSPEVLRRLRDLMAQSQRDELAIERAFLGRQASMRAFFDLDGLRLLGMSAGLRGHWPHMMRLVDRRLADHLVGDVGRLFADNTLAAEAQAGSIVLISGVADKHLRFENRNAFRHRWYARIRRYGPRLISDMHYEPCAPDAPLGLESILRLDDIAG
jgi:transcriptional regulator with XRE-family HTH domain